MGFSVLSKCGKDCQTLVGWSYRIGMNRSTDRWGSARSGRQGMSYLLNFPVFEQGSPAHGAQLHARLNE
jgi:hypothetical protein